MKPETMKEAIVKLMDADDLVKTERWLMKRGRFIEAIKVRKDRSLLEDTEDRYEGFVGLPIWIINHEIKSAETFRSIMCFMLTGVDPEDYGDEGGIQKERVN